MAEPAGGFQDPEEVFGKMFGGDRFDDFIGQISIGKLNPITLGYRNINEFETGKDMKDAFQQQHEEEGDMMIGPTGRPMLTPEAAQRKLLRDRAKQEEVSYSQLPR